VINNSRFTALYKQLVQLLAQYVDQAAQYEEAIKRQYAPKLRQKEEELARRLGREVRLDPFQDPEFIAFYNQNMNSLKDHYGDALEKIKEGAIGLFKESTPL
jgi:hypothetical protein